MEDLIHLYRKIEHSFFTGIASKCLDIGHDAHAYMTTGTHINFIYVTGNTNSLSSVLESGKQFFDQDNLSFDVIIPQNLCTPQTINILRTMTYHQSSHSVSMGMTLDDLLLDKNTNVHSDISIRANDHLLNEWMTPLIGAFESTQDICTHYAKAHKRALDNGTNLYHFSLYEHNEPVSSITLSLYDALARIDDMGTLPAFQGKGYATLLAQYALSKAKEKGAHHCFLESSKSGLSMYQHIGFRSLFENNVFTINT